MLSTNPLNAIVTQGHETGLWYLIYDMTLDELLHLTSLYHRMRINRRAQSFGWAKAYLSTTSLTVLTIFYSVFFFFFFSLWADSCCHSDKASRSKYRQNSIWRIGDMGNMRLYFFRISATTNQFYNSVPKVRFLSISNKPPKFCNKRCIMRIAQYHNRIQVEHQNNCIWTPKFWPRSFSDLKWRHAATWVRIVFPKMQQFSFFKISLTKDSRLLLHHHLVIGSDFCCFLLYWGQAVILVILNTQNVYTTVP